MDPSAMGMFSSAGVGGSVGPNDRTVYVGNVGKDVDEQTLHMLFVHCGQVTQIRIAGDPSYETRFAFVEFAAPDQASTAVLLDGMTVFDRNIKVSMARGGQGAGGGSSAGAVVGGGGAPRGGSDPDRVTRTIHVGGIPMDVVSEEQLADYFKHVGEVVAVRKSGRFAWVEFESVKSANQALGLDGESLGNSTLRISQSKTPIHTAGWRRGGAGPGPVGGSPGASSMPVGVMPPGQQGYPPQMAPPHYGAQSHYGAPPQPYGYGMPPPPQPGYGGGYNAPAPPVPPGAYGGGYVASPPQHHHAYGGHPPHGLPQYGAPPGPPGPYPPLSGPPGGGY